jgi:hypothetical protein
MASSASVTGFLPSVNGFAFTNSFPPEPTIRIDLGPFGTVGLGNASQGVCGGMAFAVRDYVQAGRPIPADTQPPAAGSPLFDYLVRRLIESFDVPGGVATYASWMVLPDTDIRLFFGSVRGTFARTVLSTWPQVKSDIDGGQLSPLGLVTVHSPTFAAVGSEIGKCHQVLAYAYRFGDDGTVAISVYDPNTARATADDVHITINIKTPGRPSPITHNINIAEPTLHGFFRSRYAPAVPPA